MTINNEAAIITPEEMDLVTRANSMFGSNVPKSDVTLSEEDVFRLARVLFPLWYHKKITAIPWSQVETRVRQTRLLLLELSSYDLAQ